jgi:hypothetical protein
MSMYDTSWICLGCKEEERKRPDYKLAEARDMEVYASKLDSLGMGPQADNVRSLAVQLRGEHASRVDLMGTKRRPRKNTPLVALHALLTKL